MTSTQPKHSFDRLPPALTAILPPKIIKAVYAASCLYPEELRLHSNRICTLRGEGRTYPLDLILEEKELREILRLMCGGSLYAYGDRINQGYLTLHGGVRVGVCGSAATEGGRITGICAVTALVIRIPHRVMVDPTPVTSCLLRKGVVGGVLIYAPPGVGKTTLLRAVAADAASPIHGRHTVVVDTREELAFLSDDPKLTVSVLSGYPRAAGIEIAVRSLGAQLVVCDEIGDEADARAILYAANCGVPLLCTAHAAKITELLSRPAFLELHRAHIFSAYVGISRLQNRFIYDVCDWSNAEKSRIAQTGI